MRNNVASKPEFNVGIHCAAPSDVCAMATRGQYNKDIHEEGLHK